MDIFRMEREAKDRMSNKEPMRFRITGPSGSLDAEWLDPYFSIFRIDGKPGILMTKQFADMPIDVHWLDDGPTAA